MLKVTYTLKGTYSSKHPNDGHLMARSITHISRSTIRGALMASAFKYKGTAWTEKHFHRIKEAKIFPQEPQRYSKQQEKRARLTTKTIERGLNKSGKSKEAVIPKTVQERDALTTVGIREYVYADTVTFYIDEIIPDVVELLSNITRLGDSESLVALESLERTNSIEHALVPTGSFDYTKQYTHDWDWLKKMTFEQINVYDKNKRKTETLRCTVQSFELPTVLAGLDEEADSA